MDTTPQSRPGWLRETTTPPLVEVFRSIRLPREAPAWRRFLAFIGPGYLVAVGYMDPGNWATSLAGGSQFGYALLFVALLSNIMAIILQSLCARLAIGTGKDLAQATRDAFPAWIAWPLWVFAEIAIIATDLAEVVGTAIGLNLIFGIPLELGILITTLDVFLILVLQAKGFRWIEAFVMTMLGVIAVSFILQIILANPDWGGVIHGFAPTTEIVHNPNMLYLALGIIGATVMPHNLYLHSGIVQTRAYGDSLSERREALAFSTWDSVFALTFALTINASLLVLAAAVFHPHNQVVTDIAQASHLLTPLLGSTLAPILFGIALIACGLNSTVTATMAGQIVMEGFVHLRIAAWARRLITRGVAIVPALLTVYLFGAAEAGRLLVFSQVVLSFQLPFAVVPLVMFTASRRKLGDLAAPRWLTAIAGIVATIIIGLNLKLIFDFVTGGLG
ncbi:MAG TPA: Nramp family divalent metal transporter [Devosia sp.]|nr:Nramp family divalent metal transporter [Devosia sp.]